MIRNQLQRVLNRVKSHTPRLWWTACGGCEQEFKHESMFYFKYQGSGPFSHGYKVWMCKKCCPTQTDVLLNNVRYFQGVDLSSLTPTKGG